MGPGGPIFFPKEGHTPLTTTHDKERELHAEIAPRVEHDLPGVQVLAVELRGPDHFTVYVDHADGVDHAVCVAVTDVLRDYLREYTVDVSSPGVDRPLRTPAHFARVVGHRVKVRTRAGRTSGEVVAVDDTHVTVDETAIPYEEIVRANLIDER